MLSKEILAKIKNKEITSRRQLYRIVGRTRELRLWLDENNLLIPKVWTKAGVLVAIKDLHDRLGRLPTAADDWGITCQAQRKFGSWNEALYLAIGKINQNRYDDLTDQDLLNIVREFVIKFSRIPMREEFDGKTYPYFETYFSRFQVRRWSDIIGMIDLANVKYFTKHGWGTKIVKNGITYLSAQEALIGSWLEKNYFEFEKEVPYGENNQYLFDFYVPRLNVYIEYYGIETPGYKERIGAKRKLYGNRRVIEIFKHENTIKKLVTEVQRL